MEFSIYENPAFGIRIKYPSNWTKSEGEMGTVVIFLSEFEDIKDTYRENLNITFQNLSAQPITLHEYSLMILNQLKLAITKFKIVEQISNSTLANNPANKLIFTYIQGKWKLKSMQIWTIKNTLAYLITYVAEIKKFKKFMEIAKEMIDSFEIFTIY